MPEQDDEDRCAILARRRSLIRAALASLGTGAIMATAASCACLSPLGTYRDTGQDSRDETQTDASITADDGGLDAIPLPCLSRPLDSSFNTPDSGTDVLDDSQDDVTDAKPSDGM